MHTPICVCLYVHSIYICVHMTIYVSVSGCNLFYMYITYISVCAFTYIHTKTQIYIMSQMQVMYL